MTAETDEPLPTSTALQRRVLATGVVCLAAFVGVAVLLSSTGQPDWLLVPAVVLVYLLLARPMMAPVRDALRTRRAVAFRAWQEQKGDDDEH